MKYTIVFILVFLIGSCSEKQVEVTSLKIINGLYCKSDTPYSGKIIQRDNKGNKLSESICEKGIVVRSNYYDIIEEPLSFVDYNVIKSYAGKPSSVFRIQLGSYQEGSEDEQVDYYIDIICLRSFKDYDSITKMVLTLPEVKKRKIESISFKTAELEESFHEVELK